MHYNFIYKYINLFPTLLTLMPNAWIACLLCQMSISLTQLRRDPDGRTTSQRAGRTPSPISLLSAYFKTVKLSHAS